MTDKLVSFAQNAEDVVLARAFADQDSGFYVDVGAYDPTIDSVTRLFYDRGWRGVNIDVRPDSLAAFTVDRPRDVNLLTGVGAVDGELTLFEDLDCLGMSTLSTEQADVLREMGHRVKEQKVAVRTLGDILAEHAPPVIDFLKIDVEGFEGAVLDVVDWSRWRPRVIVVEVASPDLTPWEQRLLAGGYARVLWDGINVFFVRDEDHEPLATVLARPATAVLDNFVPWLFVEELLRREAEVRGLARFFFLKSLGARLSDPLQMPSLTRLATVLAELVTRRLDVQAAFGTPPDIDLQRLLLWSQAVALDEADAESTAMQSVAAIVNELLGASEHV